MARSFSKSFGLPPFETFCIIPVFLIKLSHSLPLSIIRFEDLKLNQSQNCEKRFF